MMAIQSKNKLLYTSIARKKYFSYDGNSIRLNLSGPDSFRNSVVLHDSVQ